jgi:hypothetical protein
VPAFGKYWKSLEAHLKYENQFPSRLHKALFEDGTDFHQKFKTREKMGRVRTDSFIEDNNKELMKAIMNKIHEDRLREDKFYREAWNEVEELCARARGEKFLLPLTSDEMIKMSAQELLDRVALEIQANKPINIVGEIY